MQITSFCNRIAVFSILFFAVSPVWSFGGGGDGYSPKCKPPKFKNLKPAKNIEPGGELSFTASSNTLPDSIQVVIKDLKVDLTVRDHYGYQVKGNLPAELTEGFALANIIAHSSPNTCITEKKWLFKIGKSEAEEAKDDTEAAKDDTDDAAQDAAE